MESLWGFINRTGKFVIEPQFQYALPFSGDRALVFADPRKEIANHPSEASFFYTSAITSRREGDIELARAQFRKAIELAPKSDYARRSQMFLDTSIPKEPVADDAVKQYLKARELLIKKQYSNAETLLNTAISKYPQFEWLYALLADLYIETKQLNKAERILSVAITKNPKYVRAYAWLSRCWRARGDQEKANKLLAEAIALNPYDELVEADKDQLK
jgi:Putative Zn-dependent protease, contains TPR repeats